MMVPRLIGLPFNKVFRENFNSFDTIDTKGINKINGVSLCVFEMGDRYAVNGLQLSLFTQILNRVHGFSAAVLISQYDEFKGVMCSGLLNKARIGKGLQFGLINNTQSMYGMQIGLVNKIGHRTLPLINMRFKKKK
jgi:hypothetical protein